MISFLVPYLFIVVNHLNINKVPMNEFEIPKTWTKDFAISYSFSGSMDGSRTELKISYDSCSYTIQSRMNAPKKGAFSMTETNRADILKKLHDLKVNTIKSEVSIYPVHDGYSETLCFGRHCISGGTSAIMNDKDREIFSNAHAYLTDFVRKKSNAPMNEFELPKTWTKDFTISYSFSTTKLKFSYDSCNYTIQPGNSIPQTGVFAMTEADRTEILKKMHELKVNTIKYERAITAVSDGWEKSLGFGVHEIEGGSSYTMSNKHKEIFSNTCQYLMDFVLMKRSKTK